MIVPQTVFVFSGATNRLVDEGQSKVIGTRDDVVVNPWKKMCCVWSLMTSEGPKLLTVASRRGRTLLFEGRVDLSNVASEGEEHGDALVLSAP